MYFTGDGHESSTSLWSLVQEPVVSDTLRNQCIFPGMGTSTRMSICIGSGMSSSISISSGAGACSSGYIKGLMYFSGDGHEDEYEVDCLQS